MSRRMRLIATTAATLVVLTIVATVALAETVTKTVPVKVTLTDSNGATLGTATINVPLPVVTVTKTVTVTPTPTASPTSTSTSRSTSVPTLTPTPTPTPMPMPTPTPTPTAAAWDGSYGCRKPATTSTISNLRLTAGAHDLVYDHVRFTGYSGHGEGDWSTVAISASGGAVHDVTFRDCVFSTPPVAGNTFHMWAFSGGTIYNIRFENCYFEHAPRMAIEMNGRAGWWHDVWIEGCTLEACGGELISADMSPVNDDPTSPYGASVNGVVRGVEGLHIVGNDLQGTGWGPAARYTQALELVNLRPYSGQGYSEVVGNRVGRAACWFNDSYDGNVGLLIADNLFDETYDPSGSAETPHEPFQGDMSKATIRNNTFIMTGFKGLHWGASGSGNRFTGNVFRSSTSLTYNAAMPWASTEYTNNRFELPSSIAFASGATGSGNYFQSGHSGGSFD
jgi:hypothetical protein